MSSIPSSTQTDSTLQSAYPIFNRGEKPSKSTPTNQGEDTIIEIDRASQFGAGCGSSACGIGTVILGGLCAIQSFVAKSFCCLACAVCVIANGAGCFFKGIYRSLAALFGSNEKKVIVIKQNK